MEVAKAWEMGTASAASIPVPPKIQQILDPPKLQQDFVDSPKIQATPQKKVFSGPAKNTMDPPKIQ
jgi:hypothetical protein